MKHVLLLTILSTVAACGQPEPGTDNLVSVNLDYANTSLGFRNSGALSTGRLMLWDTSKNELITLATDIPLASRPPTTPVRLEATSVRGGQITGGVDLTAKAKGEISTEIRNNLSFVVTDAVRIDNTGVYSAISTAYTKLMGSGINAQRAWRIDDAITEPQRFKFVLLRDEVRASQEVIEYNKSTSGSVSFTIVDEVKGDINVSFSATTASKCIGENVVCYVNVTVLKVHLNDTRNLDYEPVGYDRKALAQAFRDLN